jgi:hypothetical protein
MLPHISYNLSTGTLSAVLKLNFLVCVKIVFCKHYFRKGKDPDPHLLLMNPDPDPGGPKTSGSESPTLQ